MYNSNNGLAGLWLRTEIFGSQLQKRITFLFGHSQFSFGHHCNFSPLICGRLPFVAIRTTTNNCKTDTYSHFYANDIEYFAKFYIKPTKIMYNSTVLRSLFSVDRFVWFYWIRCRCRANDLVSVWHLWMKFAITEAFHVYLTLIWTIV